MQPVTSLQSLKMAKIYVNSLHVVTSTDQAVAGEDPSEYTRPQKSNVIYDLWTLGNLKILVRYSYHGVYSPSRRKQVYIVVCHVLLQMNSLLRSSCCRYTDDSGNTKI